MHQAMKHLTTDEMVLTTLRKSKAPMSAYAILDALRKHGIKSPPLVYRALEKLINKGTAHRVDALGSYVACSCDHGHHHAISALTVCTQCKNVTELHDEKIIRTLTSLRDAGIAIPDDAVIELPVVCAKCTN